MQNQDCLQLFESYLRDEKKASANTLSSYLRDVRQYGDYLELHMDCTIVDATEEEAGENIKWL